MYTSADTKNTTSTMSSFTEASLAEVLSRPDCLAITLFLLIQILLAIFGNVLVLRTIQVTKRLHFGGYYFIASLAIADLLVGVLVIPVSLFYSVSFDMKGRIYFLIL